MGTPRRSIAILAVVATAAIGGAGCFGYNGSAKGWSYVGDSVLIAAGGGVIAASVLTKDDPAPCMANMKCPYESAITGAVVVGVVMVTAGLIGIALNATRPNLKTSR